MLLLDFIQKKTFQNLLIFLLFLILLFIGLAVYKDYGVHADELYSRYLGLVSLKYVLSNLMPSTSFDLQNLNTLPNLQTFEWRANGVTYEIFLLLIENFFNLKDINSILYSRRITNFLIFFISNIALFFTIKQLYKNNFLAMTGVLLLFFSPRIFAHSFFNNKDLIFLSFIIISLFFLINLLNKIDFKNIIFFSIFSSLCIGIRVMGIYLPFLFLFFYFLDCINKKNYFFSTYKLIILFIFMNIFLVILFWPFLWESPLNNFIYAIKSYSHFPFDSYEFYLGSYVHSSQMPWHYPFVWIFITTPIGINFLFIIGCLFILIRLSKRFIKIENNDDTKNMWTGTKEKVNLFLFFCFIAPIVLVISLNSVIYNGWRHLFFIYPFLILISVFSINYLFVNFKKNKSRVLIKVFLLLIISLNVFNVYKFHPFQNVYFNSLIEKNANKYFVIDYWGISNFAMLDKILEINSNNNQIDIGVKSFTDLSYNAHLLSKNDFKIMNFTGTDGIDPDFIVSNYYYEGNPKYLKKYNIPDNYEKIYSLKKGNIIINDLFIKK